VARLQGSVLAGLDKNRAARQGSNEGGHAMRYCFHLLPYHMIMGTLMQKVLSFQELMGLLMISCNHR